MPPATLDQSVIDLADIAMDACHMGHARQPIENIVDFLRRQFHIWTFWRGNFVSDECWTFLVREQNLMRALTRTMRSTFIGLSGRMELETGNVSVNGRRAWNIYMKIRHKQVTCMYTRHAKKMFTRCWDRTNKDTFTYSATKLAVIGYPKPLFKWNFIVNYNVGHPWIYFQGIQDGMDWAVYRWTGWAFFLWRTPSNQHFPTYWMKVNECIKRILQLALALHSLWSSSKMPCSSFRFFFNF